MPQQLGNLAVPVPTSRVRRPPSNRFVERLHRTLLDENFRVMGRKKFYARIQTTQSDIDANLVRNTSERPHQGRGMKGRTPADLFVRYLPKPRTPREKMDVEGPLNQPFADSTNCQAITLSVQVFRNPFIFLELEIDL